MIKHNIVFPLFGVQSSVSEKSPSNTECPVDSVMLGNATWTYLHTMAAYYPDSPTTTQQKDMSSLISNFSKFYPCDYCSEHMREWYMRHYYSDSVYI